MYFSTVLELFTSILSTLDQWIFNSFEISISLADNSEKVVVAVFALSIIGFLLMLSATDSSKKIKLQNFDGEEKSKFISKLSPDHVPSLASANGSEDIIAKEEIGVGARNERTENTQSTNDLPKNDLKASIKQNIYELDNGFVINKRSSDTLDAPKIDEGRGDKQEKVTNNVVEAKADQLDTMVSSDNKLNISVELATIETEMLDIRKEYKSGKISSLDYLTKTQALYSKGEVLVQSSKSFN